MGSLHYKLGTLTSPFESDWRNFPGGGGGTKGRKPFANPLFQFARKLFEGKLALLQSIFSILFSNF